MPLSLHSQAVHAYDGFYDLATNGNLISGDWDSIVISAAALRFELPNDFSGSEEILDATLNLWIRRAAEDSVAEQRHAIGVLAETDQSLPTTGSGVSNASRGSEQKTVGYGSFSPSLDHSLSESFAAVQIDLKAAFEEAQSAGRLDGGFVVVLIQPLNYDSTAHVLAHGIGNGTPATLTFDFAEPSPPPPPLEVWLDETLEGVALQAEAESVVHAALNETLQGVSLSAAVALFTESELDEELDGVAIEASVFAGDFIEVDLAETLDGVSLDSEVVSGISVSLDEELDGVSLEALAVVRRGGAIRGLLAETGLFAGSERSFGLFG